MKSDPHPSWTATVRSIFTITLLLGLLLRRPPSLSLQAAADADGVGVESTKDIPTTVELPSAATADWWTTVQADIRQSEYHITWQEHAHLADQAWAAGAYQAPNRAHNLRTTFTPQGIRVIPRVFAGETPPWEWGLTLIGYGTASTTFSTYDNRVHALGQATLQSKANRIEYRRDLLTEWYVNDERGLEQGFTLHEPPLGLRHAPGENISLHLALRGDLTPHLAAGAEAIEFITSGGVAVLQYDQLSVYDASGRRLPAHLDLVGLSSGGREGGGDRRIGPAIRILIEATAAAYPITVDPLTTSPVWTAESDQNEAHFGAAVGTAGDVNDDGYADVIIGAQDYDNGQTNEGAAFVYHGGPAGLGASPAWMAEGDQADAAFGTSVGTAGDVNGDGYGDVIVGADGHSSGESNEGRATVYYGGAAGLGTAPAWTAEGDQEDAAFGTSVGTAGDVNDDGYADVIVGADGYDNGHSDEGGAFVYHGSLDGLGGSPAWTAAGGQANAHFGAAVGTAGDVNGDGYADVIVGALWYRDGEADEGRAAVYHGGGAGLSTAPDWTAEGDQANARFGSSVATAGDVNGDGYDDVIVGAFWYEDGQTGTGRAFVYHGSTTGLGSAPAWTGESDQADAWFGRSVGTAGDVNADGYADVIIGADWYDGDQSNEGRAYVYHGSAAGLGAAPAWTAEGEQTFAYFGHAVGTAGDVDGDGYADVIVGAPYYTNGDLYEGRAHVYRGSATGLVAAVWMTEGDQADAWFGWSVGTAGDVDGDGYSDVIVGALWYDSGQTDEGRAFVYHGSAAGLALTPAWMAEPDRAYSDFGRSVGTAGDVNGDGYADVIVGAPYYTDGQTEVGRAFVYHGGAAGLGSTPAWTVESDQANAGFGVSVGTAGDVNGDGYADVVVGAHRYTTDDSAEGRVFVYHGSVAGLGATPAWTTDGNREVAWFGSSVGAAGDVNGDGYADVIVGAPYYDTDHRDEGQAFVYQGSAAGLAAAPAWRAEGEQADARFGWSVGTAGDVNGDGYADVIVSAIDYDSGETDEGRAYVYHGGAAGLGAAPAWMAESDQDAALFGACVGTAGDVDGDGYAEVIIGAYGYDEGQTDEGRAYVYRGGADGLRGAPAWTAEGEQVDASFGWSVGTAGDVNGDGYADVIVGAKDYDSGETDEGRAFVYHGSPAGLSASVTWTARGQGLDAAFGASVGTAGDVNGDGYADVIIGAHGYDHGEAGEGRALVYHGSATGLGAGPAWTAEGDQENARFGRSVGTAGDVNGDGYADVIVGAYSYDHGETDEGRAFVYHGSAAGLAATPAWTDEGDQDVAWFGSSVGTAGDVNGDGYADVIVGANTYDAGQSNEGRAFVYCGSAAGLGTAPAWTAEGDQDDARLGCSVGTAGDVNGDGYSDVIVGALWYDGGQRDEGRATVYHGGAEGLSGASAWTAEGDQAGAYFGTSVGTAGDVNGDGYADVIVGARLYDHGQSNEGRAFVYHGSAAGLGPSPAWTAESDQAGARFGRSVGTAGDVNGDGYADVIVGADGYDNWPEDEGRACVYHGGPQGLGGVPAWTAESNQADASFGWSVGTAGDVNGDGYADAIVGAPDFIIGETYGGLAFLYHGNDGGGLNVRPRQRRSDGSAPIAYLGMSDAGTAFQLSMIGRTPLGRDHVRLEWQVAPLGTPFSAPAVIKGASSTWIDTGTGGVAIEETVSGLTVGTPYHWRARLLYLPGNVLGQSAGRWIHIPWNGWQEADLRTPSNQPPVADAGADQTVDTDASVTLDGSGSSDPDGDLPLTYGWTQVDGPAVALSDPSNVSPTFSAPSDPAELAFTLVVTDSLGMPDPTPDEVVITVANRAPMADAGADQTVDTDATVTLDGGGSSDPDGDLPLAYGWTQVGGPAITLSDATAVNPTFSAPSDPAVLTFNLTVTDSLGLADPTPDGVTVMVRYHIYLPIVLRNASAGGG